jgi:ABC-type multidrug transport system fused ATPase/permease subunit
VGIGTIVENQEATILQHAPIHCPPAPAARWRPRVDWATLARLLPYLWQYKCALAARFMVGAKLANVGVPLLLKHLVDAMTSSPATRGAAGGAGGPAAGLWRAAPVDLAVHRAARAGLCQGHAGRGAQIALQTFGTCMR